MGMRNECHGPRARTLRLAAGVVLACAALLCCGGCAMFGIERREPMIEVGEVHCVPPAGVRTEDVVAQAAQSAGWTVEVGSGSVRCVRAGGSWRCVVDVLCGPASYSIKYVDSSGLNYVGDGTIHPGYNRQVRRLQGSIAKRMSGMLRAASSRRAARAAAPAAPVPVQPQEAPYELQEFKRDLMGSYRFEFRLKGSTSGGVDVLGRIKDELRRLVLQDSPGGVQPGTEQQVEFPEFSQSEGRVWGRVVLKVVQVFEELEFVFDPDVSVGRMVVGYAPGRLEDARNWARNNIARRMKDKHASFLARFGVEPRYTTEGEKTFVEDGRQKLLLRFHVTQ